MHRTRSFSVVLGVSCLTVLAVFLAVGSASANVDTKGAAGVAVVTVTAGKPSELAFKLSKFSNLPVGTIIFNVTNQGVAFHTFKLCTVPVTSLTKNACVGEVTKLLHHGDTATLTVKLTKSGKYEYLCDVSGHAAAGMKGLIGVGVAASAPVAAAPATSSSSSSSSSTTSGGGGTTSSGSTAPPAAGGGQPAAECPPGTTIPGAGVADEDADERGDTSDGDGCI